jgi:tetratricopeptide (TPR) repeat protein
MDSSRLLRDNPANKEVAMRSAAVILLFVCVLPLSSGCSATVRGSMALADGDYPTALERYNEALAAEPDSIYIRQRIGLTYFTMKDYTRAQAAFEDILALAPGEPNATFYLGLSRIGKGEVDTGLRLLAQMRWPDKFMHQKFVQEEAQLLLQYPGHTPDDIIWRLQDALEKGRREQDKLERDLQWGSLRQSTTAPASTTPAVS